MHDYGGQLKLELRRQGKTQAWLAQELGVTTPAISHWVQGTAKVPDARKGEIEALLGWQPNDRVDLGDLEGKWEAEGSPMAFLLAQEVPEVLVPVSTPMPGVLGSQEYRRRALELWSRALGCEPEHLVKVAERRAVLQEWQVRAVFVRGGVVLTYLGEHLGEAIHESVSVERWLREAVDQYRTWQDLLVAVEVEARAPDRQQPISKALGRQRGMALAAEVYLEPIADDVYEYWLEVVA